MDKNHEQRASLTINFFSLMFFTFALVITAFKTRMKIDTSSIVTIATMEFSFILRTLNWIIYFT